MNQDNFNLTFISEVDFEKHVSETLESYKSSLLGINLENFNKNIIDPIKLLFDKSVYKKTFEEIIKNELQRQRDKSDNNVIGYFHQNMFKYIQNCTVPKEGWDVIFKTQQKNIYVEMKNKHNTMNSGAAQKIYIQMQNHILNNPNDYCYFVEVISKCSRNIPWGCSVNGIHVENEKIRRVSIDQFYKEVTGINDAFYQICLQLPKTIEKLISQKSIPTVGNDTVIDELKNQNPDILKSLYLLAFKTYEGFGNLVVQTNELKSEN